MQIELGTLCFMYQIFYLPLAPFIPPTQFLVHTQLNLLYQFWIHTEVYIIMYESVSALMLTSGAELVVQPGGTTASK